MKTRTEVNPHYAEVNKNAARRNDFRQACGWKWLLENQPKVAEQIAEEAQHRWPSPKNRGRHTKKDFSFLSKVKP